jgi:hypothetical protein
MPYHPFCDEAAEREGAPGWESGFRIGGHSVARLEYLDFFPSLGLTAPTPNVKASIDSTGLKLNSPSCKDSFGVSVKQPLPEV